LGGGAAYAEWRASERAADEANAILQHLLLDGEGLAHNEIDALWQLASTNDERVRDSFAAQLLHSTTFAGRFNRRPEPVVLALVGLSPRRAERLGQEATASGRDGDPLPLQVAALNVGLLAALKSIDIGRAVPGLTSGFRGGSEEVQPALARLINTVDRTQAQAAVDAVLAAMQGTTNPYALESLAQVYQALAPKAEATRWHGACRDPGRTRTIRHRGHGKVVPGSGRCGDGQRQLRPVCAAGFFPPEISNGDR
jgi:hypothetical protein